MRLPSYHIINHEACIISLKIVNHSPRVCNYILKKFLLNLFQEKLHQPATIKYAHIKILQEIYNNEVNFIKQYFRFKVVHTQNHFF